MRIVASPGQLDKLEALGWLLCDALGCVKVRDCWEPLSAGSSFCWDPELQGSTSPSSSLDSRRRGKQTEIDDMVRRARAPHTLARALATLPATRTDPAPC